MNPIDDVPTVSVIIPAYNHEKYIGQTIQSVLDQTFQDFELVITDDGSTDRTVAEIRKFDDPRIRLFLGGKNQGSPVVTRNNLAQAKGKYIAFLASDDLFMPEKLDKQVRFLNEHPQYSAVFSTARIIDDNGNDFLKRHHFYYHLFDQPNRTRYEWLRYFFYNFNCLCHPSVLIRREFCDITGYTDRRYRQLPDYDLWIRLCLISEIHILQEQLVKFRVRDNEANASGNRPEIRVRTAFEHAHILNNYLLIKTTDEFFRIFPDASRRFSGDPDDELIPYYLAMLALDVNIPFYTTFAMNTLFEFFGNDRLAEKCALKEHFSYRDFAELRGRYDIYGIGERYGYRNIIRHINRNVNRLKGRL